METILIIWLIVTGLGIVFLDRRLYDIKKALGDLTEAMRSSGTRPDESSS